MTHTNLWAPMKLTDMTVSFLLMAAADFPLLRRSYETDRYDGQFPLDGSGGFSAAEALTRNMYRTHKKPCGFMANMRICMLHLLTRRFQAFRKLIFLN